MFTVKTRKVIVTALTLILAFGTASQALATNEKNEDKKVKTVLTVATPFKPGHILADASEKFKVLVEEKSKGKIQVQLEEGIDSEESLNNKVAQGLVDIQFNAARPLEVFSPQYFFFNAPYVIKDYEHFERVWNGPLGDQSKALIKENGNMVNLGTVYRGLRQTTSNKPIYGPADLVGLKLRLPVVPTWITAWGSLGVQPVPVPLPQLYQALQDGIAEASEGDLSQIDSFKLYEVQSHLAITNHLVAVGFAFINTNALDELNGHEKQIVKAAMEEATAFATAKTKASESSLLEKLADNGMTIVHPDADAIREIAKPTIEQMFTTQWPVTTWEEVLAQ